MKAILLIGVLFLGACASEAARPVDLGWTPRLDDRPVLIELNVASLQEIAARASQSGQAAREGALLLGWADWTGLLDGSGPCRIWIAPAAFAMHILQHEIRHCYQGAFHR